MTFTGLWGIKLIYPYSPLRTVSAVWVLMVNLNRNTYTLVHFNIKDQKLHDMLRKENFSLYPF